jgi:hypothetical protein
MDIYGINRDIGPGGIDAALPDFDMSIPPGIPGMTAPAINFRDAPVSFMMRQNNPAVFDPMVNVKNFAQSFPSNVKSGITKGLDLGKTIGSGIISLATGIPFAGDILSGITSQFENRPLGAPVIDEFGNVYDPETLNKLNALGGYYTDPARSARRRSKRIAKMLEKQKLGKKISLENLAKLQAQEKAQAELQRKAIDRMFEQGQGGSGQDFTGGRFDGAGSRGEYDADPTGFSGSS